MYIYISIYLYFVCISYPISRVLSKRYIVCILHACMRLCPVRAVDEVRVFMSGKGS
jgi:hypothetical protein